MFVPLYLGVLFFAVFIYLCKFSNKKWTGRGYRRRYRRKRTVHLEGALHPKQERRGRTGREARRQQASLFSAYGLGER